MLFKASTDYGLRAVLYLASKGSTCSSRDIAREMGIPRDYLIQIAQLLRNSGIIAARPGKNGGYRLAKDPSEITLLEIIESLRDETHAAQTTEKDAPHYPGTRECSMARGLKQAYDLVLRSYDEYLSSISLAAILEFSHDEKRSATMLASRLKDAGRRLAGETAAATSEENREVLLAAV